MALLIAAALAAVPGVSPAQEPAARPPIVVRLADGTSVPLSQWSLSYEYVTWPQGGSQAQGKSARRDGTDLWVGRKAFPLRGSILQIEYEGVDRERDVGRETKVVKVPAARKLKIVADGKTTELRPEAPGRDLLAPGVDKKLVVTARSLDLRGESLTGTKMDLCVLGYTVLVECGETAEHQVVQIEFPK